MELSESFLIQNSRKGYIYAILAPEVMRVKIGFSEQPEKRLAELQTGSPEHLVLVGYWDGWMFQEKQIHQMFDAHREKLEWFKLSNPVVSFIKAKTSVDLYSMVEIKSIEDLRRHAATKNGEVPPLPDWINRLGDELITGEDFQYRYLLSMKTSSLVGKIRALRNLYTFESDTITVSLGKTAKGVDNFQQKTRYPLRIWIAAAYFNLLEAGLKTKAVRILLDEAFRETEFSSQ